MARNKNKPLVNMEMRVQIADSVARSGMVNEWATGREPDKVAQRVADITNEILAKLEEEQENS